MPDVGAALLGHLRALYGADAEAVLDDLLALMRSFEGRIKPRPGARVEPRPGGGLCERDAVLITYGDMVREPGRYPLETLGELLEEKVADIVNTVHILPFYPYSSDDGFSVIDYLKVDPQLGDWDDVAAIGRSFRLMFDAVLNHTSAKSEWFRGFREGDERYADHFMTPAPGADLSDVFRPRESPLLTEVETVSGPKLVWTTFSADQVDLNYRNPQVLLATVETLLTYAERGADVIRLDAVAFLWKEAGTSCLHLPQTHRIIKLWRAVLDAAAPGTVLITETNVPHRDNISYFGDGSDEAHLVYNFSLPPLTLHAFHTGDATELSRWADGLSAPSTSVAFLNFLASHDGVGLGGAQGRLTDRQIGAMAERAERLGGHVSYRAAPDGGRAPYELNINFLDALGPAVDEPVETTARRFLTSQAVMLSLQGVPAIWFHSLFGSRGWADGVAETGAFRTVNREKPGRAELEAELAAAGSLRSLVFGGYRSLLRARSSHTAFSPHADQEILDLGACVFAVRRAGDDGAVLCLHNVTDRPISVDATAHVGSATPTDLVGGDGPTTELGPYQTAWLATGRP